jgi:alkaline phosphatase D
MVQLRAHGRLAREAPARIVIALVWMVLTAGADDLVVAFGSCAHQNRPQPIWRAIRRAEPDVLVLLGDNVYGDTHDPAVLEKAYRRFTGKPSFRRARAEAPLLATWDDHDFGLNDQGGDHPAKDASRALFLEYLGTENDPRAQRKEGLWGAWTFGSGVDAVQVLLLDTRWDRSGLRVAENREVPGPYLPREDEGARMLGEAQWAWLEEQLSAPAALRLIGSSIPFLPYFTGWETWANLPGEQDRLVHLIERTGASGVVMLSGDTHWAELSKREQGVPYPLWELTSSGLTQTWHSAADNLFRVDERVYRRPNFGLIRWDAGRRVVTLTIADKRGREVWSDEVPIGSLAAPAEDVPATEPPTR